MKYSLRRTLGVLTAALGMLLAVLAMTAPAVNADPPGDNGTVKIDSLSLTDCGGHSTSEDPDCPDSPQPDNDPHIECPIEVEFFNFDTGQTADITFTAHAPTGSGGLLFTENKTISVDSTGGANNDPDEKFVYNVSDFDLTAFEGKIHDVHGLHIKLQIQIYDADGKQVNPGGKKHKVFWAEGCLPETPETCPAGTTWVDANNNQVVDAGECEEPETPETCPAGTTWVDANNNQVVDAGECEEPEEVLPEVITPTPTPEVVASAATPQAKPTQVAGVQVTRAAQQLPRTGSDTLPLLQIGFGLMLLGAGAALFGKESNATI